MVDMHALDLLEEYLNECRVRRLSPRTIQGYDKMVRAALIWIADNEGAETIEQLAPMHLKRYLLYKQTNGAKPQYINDILRSLRTYSRFLYDAGYTKSLLTETIRRVKQPKVKIVSFNESEIRAMLEYFSHTDFLDTRNRTILAMLFDTGIRCDELITMRPEQIQKNCIVIHGKGDKERIVPLSPVLAKQMARYQRSKERYFRNRMTAPYLFVSKNGNKLTNEAIAVFMKEAAEAVHVRKTVRVSPHTCRHSYAHVQLRNGCDLYTLSRLLGHESVSITQRYLEGIQDEQVLKIGMKHSPLMNL